MPRTLFEKIWAEHVVTDLGGGFALVFVDRHLMPELLAHQIEELEKRKLPLKHPELTFAVSDHSVPALWAAREKPHDRRNSYTIAMRALTDRLGIRHYDVDSPDQGISHIVAAEQAIALPGTTFGCVDSHVCTVGALGVLAFAFGGSETLHVLATQTSILKKPPAMRIRLEGRPGHGVTPKDLMLHLIGTIGASGGLGYAVELAGEAIRSMGMEGRFTLCNMGVEMGASFTFIAPDDTTFDYLRGRALAPRGAAWDQAMMHWRTLATDDGATFDREITIDVSDIAPQVTWGISPENVIGIDARVPDPAAEPDPLKRRAITSGLNHTRLAPGAAIEGTPIDWVFIGSCTNNRITDLRAAAAVVAGRKVAANVTAWVVPGSMNIRAQAEREGLDRIFQDAGFNWGWPGCSMCGGQGNGFTERLKAGVRAISTINRNLPGRQGPGSITHLASPPMAAAAAIAGYITDVRKLGA
ncbi:MAG: 3-isopropylmalate dehydratase large subunit [Burkholderiales bacterium]